VIDRFIRWRSSGCGRVANLCFGDACLPESCKHRMLEFGDEEGPVTRAAGVRYRLSTVLHVLTMRLADQQRRVDGDRMIHPVAAQI
jgi:hypothetical protein